MGDWLSLVIALLGFGGTALLYRQNRHRITAEVKGLLSEAKKTDVEADDVHVQTSERVLKMVTEQLEKQQGELVTLRGDLKAQNEDLRTQANEIRTQQGDIRFLQSEIRKLKSRLRCMSERMKEYWNELVERGGSPAPLPDWIDEYMEETDDKD